MSCHETFFPVFTIEGNQLTEFPEELGEWTSMRGFSAANNLVETWPEGIFNMTALTILDLSGNKIQSNFFFFIKNQKFSF